MFAPTITSKEELDGWKAEAEQHRGKSLWIAADGLLTILDLAYKGLAAGQPDIVDRLNRRLEEKDDCENVNILMRDSRDKIEQLRGKLRESNAAARAFLRELGKKEP